MKNNIYTFFAIFIFAQQLFAQSFREEIILKDYVYKIYDIYSQDQEFEIDKYQIIDKDNNIIEHIARKYDKTIDKEAFLGIYRKNETELHFIEFNQNNDPNTLNHFVYSPNNKGKLQLVKKDFDLKYFPSDLPPKFKNNKPIHPEFPGGEPKLNEWTNENIIPYLKSKLKHKELVLTLVIDENGSASITNLSLLKLGNEIENKLISIIKEMPKWNTFIQGYKVTGIVYIPILID